MGWYINKKGWVNQPLIEKSMSDSILKGNDKVYKKIIKFDKRMVI